MQNVAKYPISPQNIAKHFYNIDKIWSHWSCMWTNRLICTKNISARTIWSCSNVLTCLSQTHDQGTQLQNIVFCVTRKITKCL